MVPQHPWTPSRALSLRVLFPWPSLSPKPSAQHRGILSCCLPPVKTHTSWFGGWQSPGSKAELVPLHPPFWWLQPRLWPREASAFPPLPYLRRVFRRLPVSCAQWSHLICHLLSAGPGRALCNPVLQVRCRAAWVGQATGLRSQPEAGPCRLPAQAVAWTSPTGSGACPAPSLPQPLLGCRTRRGWLSGS